MTLKSWPSHKIRTSSKELPLLTALVYIAQCLLSCPHHIDTIPYISNSSFEHNKHCKILSKNTLIYFQNFLNMARGVQKSDYNQGKQVVVRSVSYKGYTIQYLFTECDGQRWKCLAHITSALTWTHAVMWYHQLKSSRTCQIL